MNGEDDVRQLPCELEEIIVFVNRSCPGKDDSVRTGREDSHEMETETAVRASNYRCQ